MTDPPDVMITSADVAVRFGRTEVLQHVSGHVALGDSVTITGRSGSGKSTLYAVMAGTVFPTTGAVSVAGADLRRGRH